MLGRICDEACFESGVKREEVMDGESAGDGKDELACACEIP